MWTLLLTSISAAMFVGFVLICIGHFGVQSCYSAYGALWHEKYPPINIWSVVTFTTAVLLVPVILEASKDNPWQAVAFFCPALLIFVAATPDYLTNTFSRVVHTVSASVSAALSLVFIIVIAPYLWPLIVCYLLFATAGMLIWGEDTAMFWYEMAAYATIYTSMFILA